MGRAINSFTSGMTGGCIDGGHNANPETRLFSAVLSQAVHDAFSGHADKSDRNQAVDFLTKDSFHLCMICDLAGRDAGYVRRKIRKKLLRENGWNVDVSINKT